MVSDTSPRVWREAVAPTPDRARRTSSSRKAERFTDSLTTEYPANGSFFRPQSTAPAKAGGVNTHAVCKELSEGVVSDQLPVTSEKDLLETGNSLTGDCHRQLRVSNGQATKGVR
jgi:hypothetical protein